MLSGFDVYTVMEQMAKMGLRFHVLAHTPNVCGDAFLNEDFHGQLDRVVAFSTGSMGAGKMMAELTDGGNIDLYRVHHQDEHWRQVHDGWETVDVVSETEHEKSSSTTRSKRDRPRYHQEKSVITHYVSPDNYLLEIASGIISQGVGQARVRDRSGTRWVNVKRRPEPWGFLEITKRRTEEFYERMLLRPEFQSIGEIVAISSEPSAAPIRSPSVSSSGSSPSTKRGDSRTTPKKLSPALSKPTGRNNGHRSGSSERPN